MNIKPTTRQYLHFQPPLVPPTHCGMLLRCPSSLFRNFFLSSACSSGAPTSLSCFTTGTVASRGAALRQDVGSRRVPRCREFSSTASPGTVPPSLPCARTRRPAGLAGTLKTPSGPGTTPTGCGAPPESTYADPAERSCVRRTQPGLVPGSLFSPSNGRNSAYSSTPSCTKSALTLVTTSSMTPW